MTSYEKKENIILSICVPTYNRKQEVFDNLKNIETLINKHGNLIELLVGNNGSTDDTNLILKKFKNIKTINLIENNGINPILLSLAQQAKGKFLWLVGDDDFMSADIVDIVIKNILKNKNLQHSYFLTGRNYYSDSELQKLKKNSFKSQIKSTKTITKQLINKSGFISSHIVDREGYLKGLLKSLSYSKSNSYATKFAYLYIHQLSSAIFHINDSIFIGRITGKESYFVNNNPNLTIKTLLFDEVDLFKQIVMEKLLKKYFLWINAKNIMSPKRIELIYKAFLQKLKSLFISYLYLFFAFFVGIKDYLLIKLNLK